MKKIYLIVFLLVSFLLIDNVQAAKKPIVTCTYNESDKNNGTFISVILERYSTADDDYRVRISINDDNYYRNATAMGWNGTGKNFRYNFECPKYTAAYIYPEFIMGSMLVEDFQYPVYFGDDLDTTIQSVARYPEYYVLSAKEKSFKPVESNIKCGLFGLKTWSYIELAYNIIRYAVPILIIVLGMLDFLKVIFSGEEKDMKASGKSFMKRIIAGVILLLLPALLKFAFGLVGFSENCLQELL